MSAGSPAGFDVEGLRQCTAFPPCRLVHPTARGKLSIEVAPRFSTPKRGNATAGRFQHVGCWSSPSLRLAKSPRAKAPHPVTRLAGARPGLGLHRVPCKWPLVWEVRSWPRWRQFWYDDARLGVSLMRTTRFFAPHPRHRPAAPTSNGHAPTLGQSRHVQRGGKGGGHMSPAKRLGQGWRSGTASSTISVAASTTASLHGSRRSLRWVSSRWMAAWSMRS